jgi:AhpD family alkylhydroperoxidase
MDARAYLQGCSLEERLISLVRLRASQINGCAHCVDMHWKDLRALGDNEQRLCSLDAWRDCPDYTDRERAALAWTEAVTPVADGQLSDADHEAVRSHFTVRELADLMLAAGPMNDARRPNGDGRFCVPFAAAHLVDRPRWPAAGVAMDFRLP